MNMYSVMESSVVDRKINQFGDYEDTSNMKPEDWDYRWGKSQTQFHMPKIHPYVYMIRALLNFLYSLLCMKAATGFSFGNSFVDTRNISYSFRISRRDVEQQTD